jgi:hypothetical protein
MIGKTPIDLHLKRALLLDSAKAWIEANTDELRELIVNLIRYNQLTEQGVNSEGDIIGTYSYTTELLSEGRKKRGEPYDLNDTGEFFRSMYVQVLADSIVVNADYAKMEDQNWWNINILNLTDENLEVYIEEIKANYVKEARRILELD